MNPRVLHLTIGVAGILVFLFTGLYMEARFPDAYAATEAIRFQYRANHIYILMSALMNLSAGLWPPPVQRGWQRHAGTLSSLVLLLVPIPLIQAFFVEPPRGVAERPITVMGVALLLAAVLLAHVARFAPRSRAQSS